MNLGRPISAVGEKDLIASVIMPLVNPTGDANLSGDDCGVAWLNSNIGLCVSTDRVPWDLTSFRLGIIDTEGLGYYLAVLNLSDIAAMGAKQLGLLVNLGLPASFPVDDLLALMTGVKRACDEYECPVLGGDLSDAAEPSISATSVGVVYAGRVLRRTGARVGDDVYCTSPLGLTSTAFAYFLDAREKGLLLADEDIDLLVNNFRCPKPMLGLGQSLLAGEARMTAMDNTDGAGQTLHELATANDVEIRVDASLLPIVDVSERVADFLQIDVVDLVLNAGADFQLIGTCDPTLLAERNGPVAQLPIRKIGSVQPGSGASVVRDGMGAAKLVPRGWNYFDSTKEA